MTREERNQAKQKEIEHMKTKEKTKRISLFIGKILLIIILTVTSLVLYARYVGTSGLVIYEHKITSNKIPDSFHGLKVIQFTDLHYGSTVLKNEVNHLVNEINLRKPDLVLFTGDLIDKDYQISEKELEDLITAFQTIQATIGKYAVAGNHDVDNKLFNQVMLQSDFTILDNSSELLYYEGYDPILLVGLNSSIKEKRDIEKAFNYFNTEASNHDIFTITMLHESDSIDNILSKYPTDLALAGHSHNGQIRIPFFGSIKKINGAKKYSEPFYQINDTQLYISGGIGTSNYPFRLFDRPSFNFFRITKK